MWRQQHRERDRELARQSYHRRMKDPKKAEVIRNYHRNLLTNKRKMDLAYRIGFIGRGTTVPIEIRRALISRAHGECEVKYLGLCKGTLRCHHVENPNDHSLSNLLLVCNRHHKHLDKKQRNEFGRFSVKV